MIEDVLAGIGAGAQGALSAYSWQKERDDRRREFDAVHAGDEEERQLRIQKIRAEIEQMLHPLTKGPARKVVSYKTVGDDGKPVTKWAYEDELVGQSSPDYVEPKPAPAAPRPIAVPTEQGGKAGTLFVDPTTAPGQFFPSAPKPKKPSALGTSSKDDPSFPNGVRAYLADINGRYKTRAEAKTELDSALASLYRDHPNLDSNKLYAAFDRLFPKDELVHGAGVKPAAGASSPASTATGGTGAPLGTTASASTAGPLPFGRGRGAAAGPAGTSAPSASVRQMTDAVTAAASRSMAAGGGSGQTSTGASAATRGTPASAVGKEFIAPSGRRVKIIGIKPNGNPDLVDAKTGEAVK